MKQLVDDATGSKDELTFLLLLLILALYILPLLSFTYSPSVRTSTEAWEVSGYDAPL